jgi:septation ring formation regulator
MGPVGIVLICVIAALVVAGLVCLGIFMHKRRFKINSINLRKTYEDYHTQLTTDCANMVSRLKVLGRSNEYFNTMYNERQKQYDDILNRRDRDVASSLDALDKLVAEKKYKDYKEVESEGQQAVSDFKVAVCNFNADLTSILQDDNDVHSNAVNVKAKYREIRQFYEDHVTELKPLENSFNKVINTAEAQFAQFDKDSNEANFTEAKEILENLNKLFTAVLDVLDQLPLLEVSITTVLPQKLETVLDEYNKMLDEGFVVAQMAIGQVVEGMKAEVDALQRQLMVLDIRGVKENIDSLQARITDILASFAEERKAKDTYYEKQNTLVDSSFAVEKRYARLINQLPAYQKAFVLDMKYVAQIKTLKADIESIGILKRELDSYLDTSARQPYVVITKKMTDMDNEMSKAIQVMDSYEGYLNSLKEDSSAVFNGLRQTYVDLKNAQCVVAEIDVLAYTNSIKDEFAKDYQIIKEINDIVITKPINVPLALSKFKPFKSSVDGFLAGISNTKMEADKAETSIVYANAYRQDFTDSRALLAQAEQAFQEADFSRASAIALNIVKTFDAQSAN